MDRIVVGSAACLGDVAPFVEPANRLAGRGHDVTFLTPRGFHSLLEPPVRPRCWCASARRRPPAPGTLSRRWRRGCSSEACDRSSSSATPPTWRTCATCRGLFDQLWHGRRVEELGVGIMVTRPSKVPAAVARLLGDPGYGERARALGAALVDAVEATV